MLKNVRVIFSKTGRARFISHLDLVRTMTRVMRRAEIPLWYTEGFNRHPYLTFAAPLSLGFEGLRETMDLRLEEDMPYDELVERLNAALPEGYKAISAAEAVCKAGELAQSTYRLMLNCPIDAVRAVLTQKEILVEKRTKKKSIKMLDISPAFADAQVDGDDTFSIVTVTLPTGNGNINPSLFLQALNNAFGEEYRMRVMRLELLTATGKPFR